MAEWIYLFQQFSVGAGLSSKVMDFSTTQTSLIQASLDLFYTAVFYDKIHFGVIDPSNYTAYFYIKNVTKAMSSVSGTMQQVLTSTYDTQVSLATYILLFPSLTDYMLAFLMNLMGNILSMYSVFQSVTEASANCDYSTMALRMGSLVKKLYNVQPIQ